MANRLLVMLAVGTAVCFSTSLANAQVETEKAKTINTITAEDINNLPGKKTNITKLISLVPPTEGSPVVVLSNGPSGFTTDVKTPTGLNTIIFTTPGKDILEVYLPNHLSKDSAFTATMKLKPVKG